MFPKESHLTVKLGSAFASQSSLYLVIQFAVGFSTGGRQNRDSISSVSQIGLKEILVSRRSDLRELICFVSEFV